MFEDLARPLMLVAARMGQYVRPKAELVPASNFHIYDTLERLGLGTYKDEPDDKIELFEKVLWEEAVARGMRMREFRFLGIPTHNFVAYLGDTRLTFDKIPRLAHMPECHWWTDNKAEMKHRFEALGIPVAKGRAVYRWRSAKEVFNGVPKPVVVKPFEGSASRHTTLRVNDIEALEKAFRSTKQVAPYVVIEEELPGAVFRPTLVGGKLIATIRRDPPRVIADGTHTVLELVEEANTHPAREGPYFSRIQLGDAALSELKRQGLELTSIPEPRREVLLHSKINWALGGTTTDVTEKVHPDNVELFEYISQVLNAHIVGIDIMMEDISRSWREQKCGVIECNGRPFFDNHHLPFEGKPRNVAGVLWDQVYSE